MDSDYKKLLDKTMTELRNLLRLRLEINNRIAKLTATALALSRHLGLNDPRRKKLMQIVDELYVFKPRLTDSVKDAVYYASPKRLPAVQVKELMEVRGFDFADFANPLASVHSTLRRLASQGEIGTEIEKGFTVYWWKGPHYGARNSLANLLSEREVQKQMDVKIRARIDQELERRAGIRTVP